jgi:hypothetical protein
MKVSPVAVGKAVSYISAISMVAISFLTGRCELGQRHAFSRSEINEISLNIVSEH